MKILFVWEWENPADIIFEVDEEAIGYAMKRFVEDGNQVMLFTHSDKPELLHGKYHGVEYRIRPVGAFKAFQIDAVDFDPDLVLYWGSIDHTLALQCHEVLPRRVPIGMCVAAGGINHPNKDKVDFFFVEYDGHKTDLEEFGKEVIFNAMGPREDLFYIESLPKVWDVILPAAFTSNKRHELFRDVVNRGQFTACRVGIQKPRESGENVLTMQQAGVSTFDWVRRPALRGFYNASRCVFLSGGIHGGSQRTAMEALACGVEVVALEDNQQLDSFIRLQAPIRIVTPNTPFITEAISEAITKPRDPQMLRDWVLKNCTAQIYYNVLRDKCLEKVNSVSANIT